jgi:hypothetical protein
MLSGPMNAAYEKGAREAAEKARREAEPPRPQARGPVQMLVIAFEGGEFRGEIAEELDRLRKSDTIRLLDVVAVFKDEGGRVRIAETRDGDAGRFARKLLDGSDSDLSYLDEADREDLWDVAEAIPPGSAAAVALLEHRWSIPLREAIERAGGRPIVDAWVAPEDLAEIGLPD